MAKPKLPVVAIIGDGAAQFSIGELASAVEAKLAVIFLIWNNNGYGEIKHFMANADIPQIGVDIYTPDFVGIGKAFGCRALQVCNLRDLKEALVVANSPALPTVIEVLQADFADGYPQL